MSIKRKKKIAYIVLMLFVLAFHTMMLNKWIAEETVVQNTVEAGLIDLDETHLSKIK
jgi:hypothetical protein